MVSWNKWNPTALLSISVPNAQSPWAQPFTSSAHGRGNSAERIQPRAPACACAVGSGRDTRDIRNWVDVREILARCLPPHQTYQQKTWATAMQSFPPERRTRMNLGLKKWARKKYEEMIQHWVDLFRFQASGSEGWWTRLWSGAPLTEWCFGKYLDTNQISCAISKAERNRARILLFLIKSQAFPIKSLLNIPSNHYW